MSTPPTDAPPKAPRTSWLRRVALMLVASLVALGLAELVARALYSPPAGGYPAGMFCEADDVGFALTPGFEAEDAKPGYTVQVHINRLGFREDSLGDGSRPRVVCIGDSFCFGHGVEANEAYPAVVEQTLAAEGKPAEAINMGVPGYGTLNALALLRRHIAELKPAVVVLGLYVGNDYMNNHPDHFGKIVSRSGMLVTKTDQVSWGWLRLKTMLATRSRLVQFLFSLTGRELTKEEQIQAVCGNLEWDPGFNVAVVRRAEDPIVATARTNTFRALSELRDLCAEHDAKLLVSLLPGPFQYEPAMWSTVVHGCKLDPDAFDLERPNREIAAWCAKNDIRCHDLLPAFRSTTERAGLYTDVHFGVAGHALAADAMVREIRALTGW